MFFGEFLVVKQVINEDQLLDALTYQVEHLPSFMRVLRGENIISSKDLFRMIKIQLETNSDLIGVLRDENKIDETQLHNLFAKQACQRKMLGEVLIELKIVDQSTVEKMLIEFLRDKENLSTLKTEQQKKSLKSAPKEIEMSEAALESLRELGMVLGDTAPSSDSTSTLQQQDTTAPPEANIFVEEYLNVYNVKLKNKIAKIVEILKQSEHDDSDISNYFNSLYRDFHVLKGSAQVGELTQTEYFISEWENVIEKIMSKSIPEMKAWCSVGLPALEKGLVHLWKMREAVDKDKTEANIKPAPELLDIIKTL